MIEARVAAMGLELPQPLQVPPGLRLPFEWVRGRRVFVSGYVTLQADGHIADPPGKERTEIPPEQGCAAARLVALAQPASLKRALGDLDRVTNGYSDRILVLFGPEVGTHVRSSIGMVIPLNAPVNRKAEVGIDGEERRRPRAPDRSRYRESD